MLSPLLGKKFDSIISGAKLVTAGSSILVDYAYSHNPHSYYLPTVVDLMRYIPNLQKRGGHIFTVGWIGSPSTSIYLVDLVKPLSQLALDSPVRFIVVGGKAPNIPNVIIEEHEWSEDTEIDLINSFDVGVMPLFNDPWARGKCAFKIIQYMACSVPVVASPVGANCEVVNSGCGFLAADQEGWLEAFRMLRDNPKFRAKMGREGRKKAMNQYSLDVRLPKFAEFIHCAIEAS